MTLLYTNNMHIHTYGTHSGIIRLTPPAMPGRLVIVMLLAGLLGLMPVGAAHADTSLVVTTLADSGSGSLREAINTANTNVGPTTITFSISGTILLSSTLPAIDNDITIDGTGQPITVSGNNAVRVMVVNAGKVLHLQSITIADGRIRFGGYNGNGGGIYNSGTLIVINSTFFNNGASDAGGGIFNTGALTVTNSTLAGNDSEGGSTGGGGIYNAGALTVISSTLSGNDALVSGGGIGNLGIMTVTNSTFSDNSAGSTVGGIQNGGVLTVTNSTFSGNVSTYGIGGIENGGTLYVTNSIFDNNGLGDCSSWGIVTGSHNLIENGTTACGLTNGVNGNIIGVDPLLGPLANNGGSTLTFLPLPGSPAINAGDNASCPAFDQRGVARPQGAICDIGSVESLIWPRARLLQVMR
jgi:hypothetical protein